MPDHKPGTNEPTSLQPLVPALRPDRVGQGLTWLSLAAVIGLWSVTLGPVVPLWASLAGGVLVWALLLALIDTVQGARYRRRQARDHLARAVTAHAAALRRNLRRAERRNDYGVVVSDTSDQVLAEFLASIGIGQDLVSLTVARQVVAARLDQMGRAEVASGLDLSLIPADPAAFEVWVAGALTRAGWQVQVTGASGDQGIDVMAQKAGLRAGLQCKLHSAPVGNAAVQAALAGAGYHGLAVAAVVTNAGYTRAARDLAASTGVVLMSVQDLADPDARLCSALAIALAQSGATSGRP